MAGAFGDDTDVARPFHIAWYSSKETLDTWTGFAAVVGGGGGDNDDHPLSGWMAASSSSSL